MKTSCSSWSYHHAFKAGKMDQMSWLTECAELELDGVELLAVHFPSTERDYLKGIKKTCADLYLTISMLSAGGHLTVADDAKRSAEVEEIGKWAEIAVFLGAPRVRFFCGSGPELDAGGPELYAKVVEAMKQVAGIGERHGVIMALENHGNVSADQLLSLLKDVDSPYVKFTLDTGNFPPASQVGPETYKSIERCAPHASIVHAKFFNVADDGSDKDFNWHTIREVLAKAGFRGFLSVEYEGQDVNELAVMRRIAKYLKTLR